MPGIKLLCAQLAPPSVERLTPQPSLRFQSFQPVIKLLGFVGLRAIVISLLVTWSPLALTTAPTCVPAPAPMGARASRASASSALNVRHLILIVVSPPVSPR